MRFFSFSAVAFSFAAVVAGQKSSVNHQVVVGGAAGKQFTPSQVTAAVGDTVTFVFSYMNHTVTQSSFATPCSQLQNATTGQSGFNSGFQAVAMNASQSPAWTLQITDAAPIWIYCAQMGHCQTGMVGAINAPATGNKTFTAFQALAMGGNTTSTLPSSAASAGVGAAATGSASAVSGAAATATGATTSQPAAANNVFPGGAVALLSLVATLFVLF